MFVKADADEMAESLYPSLIESTYFNTVCCKQGINRLSDRLEQGDLTTSLLTLESSYWQSYKI